MSREDDLIRLVEQSRVRLAEQLMIRNLETNFFNLESSQEESSAKVIDIEEYRKNRASIRWKRKTNTTS